MSTDASQSQGGADAPASVNNPRSAAAAATAAANAISRTKQARARTRFFDLWAVVAAILLLAAIVYLLNIRCPWPFSSGLSSSSSACAAL